MVVIHRTRWRVNSIGRLSWTDIKNVIVYLSDCANLDCPVARTSFDGWLK
jgi:hypothetical protein